MKQKAKTKCPSKACFCAVLTVWQFVCVIAIIVCGILYLKPYSRISRYTETMCKSESTFYTNQFVCREEGGPTSLYPCLLVHVSLNWTDGKTWTVALYSDDIHQANVYEERYDGLQKCSIRSCQEAEADNRIVVDNFSALYGKRGATFKCYYDPLSPNWGAVVQILMPGIRVLHAMVWPSFALLMGTLICAIFCSRCRKTGKKEGTKKGAGPIKEEEMELNIKEDGEATMELRKPPSPIPEVIAVLNANKQAKEAKLAKESKEALMKKSVTDVMANKKPRPPKPPRRTDKKKVAQAATPTEKRNVWL